MFVRACLRVRVCACARVSACVNVSVFETGKGSMCGWASPLHLIILFVYLQSALFVRRAGKKVGGSKRCSNEGRLLPRFYLLIYLRNFRCALH